MTALSDHLSSTTSRPRSDLDALKAPREAPMPTDPPTLELIAAELDTWWASLTPGQRMTLHLEYGA